MEGRIQKAHDLRPAGPNRELTAFKSASCETRPNFVSVFQTLHLGSMIHWATCNYEMCDLQFESHLLSRLFQNRKFQNP